MLPGSEIAHEASFDLTPMIDVILLLIVFFMLSSQFSRTEQLPIPLPNEQGVAAVDAENPSELVIDMNIRGELFVRGTLVKPDRLPEILGVPADSDTVGNAAKITILVRADKDAPAVHLNRLGAALARAGLSSWRLATAPSGGVNPRGESHR
ncbi:MAG: biopolymer transporter ExbD [Phycisphaerae bacterium]|nr:biopolymer transporter ExbD [Phycisphaerae bacterium]